MWDTLLSGLIVITVGWGLYLAFLSEWVDRKLHQFGEYRTKSTNADKIAMVKQVSDDAKGIEQFVTQNAEYLSKAMVQKLVNRIETLRYDSSIADDDVLKKRIANLKEPEELEDPANFGKAMIERTRR